MVKKAYMFSLEVIIALVLVVALISFMTAIYQNQSSTQQEKLSVSAIDILNILDKQGKLEELVKEENWEAIQSSAQSLAPKNSQVVIIHDKIPVTKLPEKTPQSTAQLIVPINKNNIYQIHEIILVVYQ